MCVIHSTCVDLPNLARLKGAIFTWKTNWSYEMSMAPCTMMPLCFAVLTFSYVQLGAAEQINFLKWPILLSLKKTETIKKWLQHQTFVN